MLEAIVRLQDSLQELPHAKFKRDGNDLIYAHSLPLADALGGTTVRLDQLDGRPISVPLKEASPCSDLHPS